MRDSALPLCLYYDIVYPVTKSLPVGVTRDLLYFFAGWVVWKIHAGELITGIDNVGHENCLLHMKCQTGIHLIICKAIKKYLAKIET